MPAVALRYTCDDRHLVWVADDGQVRIIDVQSQNIDFESQMPVKHIVSADLDTSCEKLVAINDDQQAEVWEVHSAKCLAHIDNVKAESCRFSDDGQTVALIGPEGYVALWQPYVRPPANPRGHVARPGRWPSRLMVVY